MSKETWHSQDRWISSNVVVITCTFENYVKALIFIWTLYSLFEECWGGPDESMGYENSVILLLCITAEHLKQTRA